jgi:iron complex outermembrane recepter protein
MPDNLGPAFRFSLHVCRCLAASVQLVFATMVPVTSACAVDLDTEVVFHIGAQPLDSALLEFSKQANTPVAFAASSIGTLRTSGLDGKYPARAALAVLLCNSGLAYSQIGDTVTVIPSSAGGISKPCDVTSASLRKD